MPADMRTYLPPPPPKRAPPPTALESIEKWISKNRALTAAAVAFLVTGSVGAVIFVRNRQYKRKRRAKKSASGARTDVVVVAGAVASPLTNALYLDLERRGFVVYVVTNKRDDEYYVRSQNRVDLIPLQLDLVDPFAAQEQLMRFRNLLSREHRAFDEAEAHKLNFVGLVLVPDTTSSPARIEDISSEEWSDALNAKVLNPIATAQLFLPSIIEHSAKIILLTPSVTPSLKLPTHALESTVYGALEGFASSLAAEMKQSSVSLSHFKLGDIDIPSVTAKQRRDGVPTPRLKPTPMRHLQDSVFDALVSKRPWRTRHIGRGSLTYDIIGSWVPSGIVGWLMGSGRKPTLVESSSDDLHGSWEKVDQELGSIMS